MIGGTGRERSRSIDFPDRATAVREGAHRRRGSVGAILRSIWAEGVGAISDEGIKQLAAAGAPEIARALATISIAAAGAGEHWMRSPVGAIAVAVAGAVGGGLAKRGADWVVARRGRSTDATLRDQIVLLQGEFQELRERATEADELRSQVARHHAEIFQLRARQRSDRAMVDAWVRGQRERAPSKTRHRARLDHWRPPPARGGRGRGL